MTIECRTVIYADSFNGKDVVVVGHCYRADKLHIVVQPIDKSARYSVKFSEFLSKRFY